MTPEEFIAKWGPFIGAGRVENLKFDLNRVILSRKDWSDSNIVSSTPLFCKEGIKKSKSNTV
jgi:hypothetical protein